MVGLAVGLDARFAVGLDVVGVRVGAGVNVGFFVGFTVGPAVAPLSTTDRQGTG